MYFINKQRCALIWATLFLALLGFVSCRANESQFKLVVDSIPTSEDDTVGETPLVSQTTLSLLATRDVHAINGVSWHPINQVFAIASWETPTTHSIQLYDVQTEQVVWFKEEIPSAIAFTPDGNFIATAPFNGSYIQMLVSENGHIDSEITSDNCKGGEWLFLSKTGEKLLIGRGARHINLETTINLWDIQTGACIELDKRFGVLNFLDVNEDFDLAIMSFMMQDRQVFVRDIQREADVCNLPGDFGLFVPHLSQFVISNEEKLTFYDASSCQKVEEHLISTPFRGYIAFSPNGELFVSAGRYLQLWETGTGKLLFQEELPSDFFGSSSHPRIVFSPNGDYVLAVFSTEGENKGSDVIQIWQLLPSP
jgi:WD40 repeat protein